MWTIEPFHPGTWCAQHGPGPMAWRVFEAHGVCTRKSQDSDRRNETLALPAPSPPSPSPHKTALRRGTQFHAHSLSLSFLVILSPSFPSQYLSSLSSVQSSSSVYTREGRAGGARTCHAPTRRQHHHTSHPTPLKSPRTDTYLNKQNARMCRSGVSLPPPHHTDRPSAPPPLSVPSLTPSLAWGACGGRPRAGGGAGQ